MPPTATVNLTLPLLLDNNSWKVFVYFLQMQSEGSEADQTGEQEVIARTRQIVRAHQETKSTVAELNVAPSVFHNWPRSSSSPATRL